MEDVPDWVIILGLLVIGMLFITSCAYHQKKWCWTVKKRIPIQTEEELAALAESNAVESSAVRTLMFAKGGEDETTPPASSKREEE